MVVSVTKRQTDRQTDRQRHTRTFLTGLIHVINVTSQLNFSVGIAEMLTCSFEIGALGLHVCMYVCVYTYVNLHVVNVGDAHVQL